QLIPGEVKRLGGANRFETAHEIYREGVGTWGNTAIIATGTTPADAISIASYSYAEAAPIFLAAYGLDKGTEEALLEGGFSRVLICGDTNSIDASVDAWCSDHAIDVVRFAGINRYDTNTKIINWLTDNELFQWDKAVVAAGQDGKWADALCAGPLVAKRGTVLLLADDYNRTTITGALHDHALPVLSTTVLGDENSVSQETFKTLKDSIAKTWIEERQWVRKVETIWAEETRSVPEIYTVKGQDHSMPTVEDPQSIVDKGYCCSGCGLEAAYSDINSNSEAIKDARTSSIIESHVATACPLSSGWTSYCKVATGGTVEENYGGHYEKTDRGGWENTAAYWSLYPDCDTTKQWVEDSTWTTDLEKVWVPNPESERSWLCKCDVCGFSSPCENLNLYTEHLLPGCMQTPRFLLVEQTVHNGYWKQIDTSYAQVTGGHWE
ncbi:MAG: cell wall-binding repeat-containing protein, partial [Raoultibacter sp.]